MCQLTVVLLPSIAFRGQPVELRPSRIPP
jgi:hypothetical protein